MVTAGYRAVSGKPIQKTKVVHGSRQDAEHQRIAMLTKYGRPTGKVLTSATVKEVLRLYLSVNEERWQPRTRTEQRRSVEKYFGPIEDIGIEDLTKADCQTLLAYLKRRKPKLGASSIKRHTGVLKAGLTWAVQQDIIQSNPARSIKVHLPAQELQVPKDDDVTSFLNYVREINPRYHAYFYWLLVTGARRGEVLGLKWNDIDQNTVVFRRAAREGTAGTEVTPGLKATKTKSLLVPRSAVALITEVFEHRRGFIFSDDSGKTPWNPNRVTKAYRRLQDQAEMPKIGRLHDLRHLHATTLLSKGLSAVQVSDRMGHTSAYHTLNTYGHALPAKDKEAANLMKSLYPLGEGAPTT